MRIFDGPDICMCVSTNQRPQPLVSVLMVAQNTASFIHSALLSARRQTVEDIEILIVDDGSTDGTAGIAQEHAIADSRVRVLPGPRRGLAAVRNVSLAEARGRFVAILDSDDLLQADHLERLLASQQRSGAEICSSNMIMFSEDQGLQVRLFASGREWRQARYITVEEFARGGMIGGKNVSLGYFKPLFEVDFLRRKCIAYDPRLRIGEDFDLVMRAMLAGARLHFTPEASYYYRRHDFSTSYRLAASDLEGLAQATRDYCTSGTALGNLFARRLRNLEGARRQVLALEALRRHRVLEAFKLIAPHPEAIRLLMSSLHESMRKRTGLPSRRELEPVGGKRRKSLFNAFQLRQLAEDLAASKRSPEIS